MLSYSFQPTIVEQAMQVQDLKSKINNSFQLLRLRILVEISAFMANRAFGSYYKDLTKNLVRAKGIKASIEDSVSHLKGEDTTRAVADLKSVIHFYIQRKSRVDEIISKFDGRKSSVSENAIKVSEILSEIIETHYSSVRMLSRVGRRTTHGVVSEIAANAAKISANSINVAYGD